MILGKIANKIDGCSEKKDDYTGTDWPSHHSWLQLAQVPTLFCDRPANTNMSLLPSDTRQPGE